MSTADPYWSIFLGSAQFITLRNVVAVRPPGSCIAQHLLENI